MKAIIIETITGCYVYMDSKPIGPFATYADACRACRRNCWEVEQ